MANTRSRRLLSSISLLFILGSFACANSASANSTTKTVTANAPRAYKDWTGVWDAVRSGPFWGFPAPALAPGAAPPPNTGAGCLPMGMPAMMMMLYLMETIATPDQLTIASEDQSIVRRIYIDGRGHPKDMWPTYAGHSIGHWEGDTLVVDTIAIRPDTTFNGRKHSDALHIVEHMKLVDPDTFEDILVADDAKAFDKPWTTTQRYKRQAKGTEVNEFVCEENNRNRPDEKGQPTFVPPH